MPLSGRPILDWVLRAAQASSEIDEVVLATSTDTDDDLIADFAMHKGIRTVRGSLEDVLGRFILAGETARADAVVRLTADCPLLDPALIDSIARIWRASPGTDYVSTTLDRCLPRGLDVECVSIGTLRALDLVAVDHHRTHVTSAIYGTDSGFSQMGIICRPNYSHYRLTVDTWSDLEAITELTKLTGDQITPWRELVGLLIRHPRISKINDHVRQKEIVEG